MTDTKNLIRLVDESTLSAGAKAEIVSALASCELLFTMARQCETKDEAALVQHARDGSLRKRAAEFIAGPARKGAVISVPEPASQLSRVVDTLLPTVNPSDGIYISESFLA
jgi:hypothetical protein